ncbi:UNVERIFIED_CONTAM: Transposon Tf2-12 polyprotein [Sesamum indicum]
MSCLGSFRRKRAVDHEIELVPGTKPPARAPYRMSQPELVELRKQLKDIEEQVPIPLVADCFDRLSRAKYFTKIDLRSGYWQVRIKEGDEAKTTVVTRYSMVFLDEFVVVYLDDIVIYRQNLGRAYSASTELYAKVSKCSFAQETISFLGHIVERGRIRMDPKKVQAIEEWQLPKDVHDLRSFLGLANYYRHSSAPDGFIEEDGDLELDTPMPSRLRQFEESNCDRPCAGLTGHVEAVRVETDASDFALGGVLMQDGHPVAFESRKLKDVERRYSVHEKELLAVVHCLRLWRHYLLGSHFVVRTDNTAVSHFMSQPKLTSRQARWQELLSEFHFVLEYRAGSSNHVADALSRRADLASLGSVAALSSSAVATSIRDRARELLSKDPAAQGLIQLVEQGKARQFWLEDGLLMTKGNRLYVPKGGDLRKSLISECHDTLWAGHQGEERTYALVQRAYYWPQMRDDVETYVRTCLICQQDKADHQKKAGLLQPLPIPKRPWESVSMDYISGLPKVGDLGSIIVVVDRLSKYATFIAAPKHVTAEGTAHLFFKHIVKYWGLPKDIVSDRDSRFTGVFWTELFKILGSKLSMSSSYHPQSDGQTERFNSMLEEYLRHFVRGTQKDWVKLLDVAQLCFNAQKSSSTNKSAFEIVTGQQPLLPHTLDSPQSVRSPLARSFSQEWKQNVDIARSCLEKAQKRMKKYADQNRRFIEFNAGDLVMVKVPDPRLSKSSRGRDPRLMQKYVGPLSIIKRIGTVAYKVELPSWWKIHNVFHVSQLKKYSADKEDDARNQPSRPQLELTKTKEKVAEAILNHRVTSTAKRNHTEYLVKWRGCSSEENTWERVTNLKAFLPLVEAWGRMSRAARALGTLDAHSAHLGHPTALLGRPTTFAQTLGFRSLRVLGGDVRPPEVRCSAFSMFTAVNRKNFFKPIIGGNEFSKLGVVYVLVSPSRRSPCASIVCPSGFRWCVAIGGSSRRTASHTVPLSPHCGRRLVRHGEVVTINNNTGLYESGNWNEYNLNPLTRIHWRASLVPAAAVIPAPIAWTLGWAGRSASGVHRSSRPFCRRCAPGLNWPGRASGAVTLKKLECSKQAYALYTLAWDNIIGFRSYYVGLRDRTFAKDVFINQERKLGARRRSDTVLVSTINDADQGSADVAFRTPPAPYEKSKSLGSGGSMVARLKLKGIDGRAPPGVEPAA